MAKHDRNYLTLITVQAHSFKLWSKQGQRYGKVNGDPPVIVVTKMISGVT